MLHSQKPYDWRSKDMFNIGAVGGQNMDRHFQFEINGDFPALRFINWKDLHRSSVAFFKSA
jgi:hypothetical protein